jgi:hypothetical protein
MPTGATKGPLGRVVVVVALANATLAPTCWSYKGDVERTCDAEHLSATKADGPALMEWLKRSVSTPEGVVLANELSTKSARDRSLQLRGEARKLGVVACPLADSYEVLAKDQDWKQDVANLCDQHVLLPGGGSAVLDITTLPDDAERLREIREWALAHLKTTDAQDIVPRVGQAAPKDRGKALRAEAARAQITTPCALADALERPLPIVAKIAIASPVLPTLTITGYDSDRLGKKYSGAAVEGVRNAGGAINTCYASGLARDPKLAGKLSVRVALDGSGKVTSALADAPAFSDKKVVKCVLTDAFGGMSFAKPDKGGVKFTIALALAPTTSLSAQAVVVAPFSKHN